MRGIILLAIALTIISSPSFAVQENNTGNGQPPANAGSTRTRR